MSKVESAITANINYHDFSYLQENINLIPVQVIPKTQKNGT